jgi:hypothetical protein
MTLLVMSFSFPTQFIAFNAMLHEVIFKNQINLVYLQFILPDMSYHSSLENETYSVSNPGSQSFSFPVHLWKSAWWKSLYSHHAIHPSWLVGAPLATTVSFTLMLVDIAPFVSLDEEVTGGACARPFRSPAIFVCEDHGMRYSIKTRG